MKKEKRSFQNRFLWAFGGGGFAIASLASLAGGNLLFTSLKRGIIGFIVIFITLWVIQLLLSFNNLSASVVQTEEESKLASSAGTKFDVSLPAESFDTPPSPDDFQPWIIGDREELKEEQVENMVQAIRTMNQ